MTPGNALEMLCSAKHRRMRGVFRREPVLFCVLLGALHPLPLLPHCMLMLWPTRCLSHGMAEMILILPAPTMGDSFGHRGRHRLGPSMTLACEGNSDWTGPTALTALLCNYQFHGEMSGNHGYNCCLLSLRAVAVHAPICWLPAGLTGHPVPHLYSQPCLSAPLDGAPQLLAPCFCGDKREAPIAPRCRSWVALRGTAAGSTPPLHVAETLEARNWWPVPKLPFKNYCFFNNRQAASWISFTEP